MTLVQLRHLLSLAQTGSFSKSAAALFLTQPALSRSIRSLEAELGQPLFDRIGRHSELTPFGREAVAHARDVVLTVEDLHHSSRSAGTGREGVLRVGMGSGPGAMLMTPLLLKIAKERPRLQLEIARGGTDLLVQALRERTLDALVIDARWLRPASDLDAQHLHDMRGCFMVRRGHPLLARKARRKFEELLRYPIASTPLSDETARILVELYGPGANPREFVSLRCEEVASLVEITRRSDAVLLAIRAAAPDLVELALQPALDVKARFALVTLRRRTAPPGLGVVRELMTRLLVDRQE